MSKSSNRSRTAIYDSSAFTDAIMSGWDVRERPLPQARAASSFAAARRAAFGRHFAGKRIVIEAGELKTRSNDTSYPFRASTEFSYLTGWGADAEPGAILVFNPSADGHECVLYFRQAAGRDTIEFYANSEIGEFWVGPRPTLEQVSADLAIATDDLSNFTPTPGELYRTDDEVAQLLSEMRLVKDEYEVSQMREAVLATRGGFEKILDALPGAIGQVRGERLVEGAFNGHARLTGNTVGYETIAASAEHSCVLHWTKNDGSFSDGDLILVDAGIELDSLYTADITRTLPVSGEFGETQRQVYQAVLDAADAAHAIVRPGIKFHEVHAAAMQVISARIREWGLIPAGTSEQAGFHRRFMVHGTSHHLGMDVHDCAQARRDMYMDGVLKPGMVFTIEPGLYFQPDDLTVPAEFRGIGVRIEDDVLVTENGSINLSASIPRTAADVEAWVQQHRR